MVCKKCNQNIPDDSVFCPFCREQLKEAKEISSANICKKCGGEVNEKKHKCTQCGKFSVKSIKSKGLKIAIIALSVLCCIFFSTTVYWCNESDYWNGKYDYMRNRKNEYEDIIEWYDENVVITQNGLYHAYGCEKLDFSEYFNVWTLKSGGKYNDPCPECIGD